jgi:hypothetical protein
LAGNVGEALWDAVAEEEHTGLNRLDLKQAGAIIVNAGDLMGQALSHEFWGANGHA